MIVAIHHLEHQIQVGMLIGMTQRAHGFCPHLHVVTLLARKVAHKKMRDHQTRHGNNDGNDNKYDFYLFDTVGHNVQIEFLPRILAKIKNLWGKRRKFVGDFSAHNACPTLLLKLNHL